MRLLDETQGLSEADGSGHVPWRTIRADREGFVDFYPIHVTQGKVGPFRACRMASTEPRPIIVG